MNKKLDKKLTINRDTLRRIGDDSLQDARGGLGNGPTLYQCTYRFCSVGTCPSEAGTVCCPREQ